MEVYQNTNNSSSLLFPDKETIENLDFRFNGKEGHFSVGGKAIMPENFIVFAPISFGQVFGNIGKHFKDTNFLSIIAYTESGAFGQQLIRIFLKGIHSGTAQSFASLLQLLQSKKIFPYRCLFKAIIKPVRKGEYDVYDLSFDYDNSQIAIDFCSKVWGQIPNKEWYNNLSHHKPSDDVICLWKNKITEIKGKLIIDREYPHTEASFLEAMQIEREKQLAKIEAYRKELPVSKAKELAIKYLKGSEK